MNNESPELACETKVLWALDGHSICLHANAQKIAVKKQPTPDIQAGFRLANSIILLLAACV